MYFAEGAAGGRAVPLRESAGGALQEGKEVHRAGPNPIAKQKFSSENLPFGSTNFGSN